MAYQPLDTTIIEGSENEGHIGLVNKSEHLAYATCYILRLKEILYLIILNGHMPLVLLLNILVIPSSQLFSCSHSIYRSFLYL